MPVSTELLRGKEKTSATAPGPRLTGRGGCVRRTGPRTRIRRRQAGGPGVLPRRRVSPSVGVRRLHRDHPTGSHGTGLDNVAVPAAKSGQHWPPRQPPRTGTREGPGVRMPIPPGPPGHTRLSPTL